MNASPRPARPRDIGLARLADAVPGVTLRAGTTTPAATATPTATSTPGDADVDAAGRAEPADCPSVRGVTLDSRAVRPGDLYAALPGAHVHGGQFAAQAAASGAVALLTDAAGEQLARAAGVELPILLAADPRALLGDVAAVVYDRPADDLLMLGITGTNGKTTTAYLLESALRQLGETTGLIGTIETRIGDERLRSVRTTPEASDLHGLLALMRERGIRACCMEVSSHALALHRVSGVRYDVAIFTNLSQDHLDFHGSMEDYFAAKAQLFTPAHAARAVVCVDDRWGVRLAGQAAIPTTTVANAVAGDQGVPDADWIIEHPGAGAQPAAGDGHAAGDPVLLRHRDGRCLRLRLGLPGAHNATNTALAAVALLELAHAGELPGRTDEEIAAAFDVAAQVPGRMQRVVLQGRAGTLAPPDAYVDFAHTPEAVAATLSALRPTTSGPLVAVLGAGGDRDPGKRPAMGAAAARCADAVVVTDDNPRHEDPAQIRAAVAGGARQRRADAEEGDGGGVAQVHDVEGRAAGIRLALRLAAGAEQTMAGGPGRAGVVAVLGKGHETGQTIGDVVTPFDDADALTAAWAQVRAESDRQVRS